jgi:hypothetical protein
MNMSKYGSAFALLSTFVALAASATGCSSSPSDNPNVSGRGEIINQTKSALDSASITEIDGTYASCQDRTDGSGWTVTGVDGTHLTGGTLSVVENDTACTLTMTSLSVGSTLYQADTAISMIATYAATASAFKINGAGATMFYGNAKLSAMGFASAFTVDVLASDAPSETDAGALAAGFATRTGTATAGTVPASNYTFDLTSGAFALTKDINNIVDAVSGYAQLTEGGTPLNGEDYAIVTGSPGSFAQVDAAWKGTTISGGPLSGLTALELPAGGFGLETKDLTDGQVRTVIVRHTVSGVSSYQTFTITFTAS